MTLSSLRPLSQQLPNQIPIHRPPVRKRRLVCGGMAQDNCVSRLQECGRKLVTEGRLIATIILPSSGGPAVEAIARALNHGGMPPKTVTLQTRSFPDEVALAEMASSVA